MHVCHALVPAVTIDPTHHPLLPSRHADIFRRMEVPRFQEFDRTCALLGTAFRALSISQCVEANTSMSKSNSHHYSSKIAEASLCTHPHSLSSFNAEASRFQCETLHTNHPTHGIDPTSITGVSPLSASSSPQNSPFLKPVSYRLLGTLSSTHHRLLPHFNLQ